MSFWWRKLDEPFPCSLFWVPLAEVWCEGFHTSCSWDFGFRRYHTRIKLVLNYIYFPSPSKPQNILSSCLTLSELFHVGPEVQYTESRSWKSLFYLAADFVSFPTGDAEGRSLSKWPAAQRRLILLQHRPSIHLPNDVTTLKTHLHLCLPKHRELHAAEIELFFDCNPFKSKDIQVTTKIQDAFD